MIEYSFYNDPYMKCLCVLRCDRCTGALNPNCLSATRNISIWTVVHSLHKDNAALYMLIKDFFSLNTVKPADWNTFETEQNCPI